MTTVSISDALAEMAASKIDLSAVKKEEWVITPAVARELLDANTRNRRPSIGHITQFTRAMRTKQWIDPIGEPVAQDTTGVVLNGAQRLFAVIEADYTWHCTVITGLPPEAQHFMDRGRRRTASDDLVIAKVKNAHLTGATARLLIDWSNGVIASRALRSTDAEVFQFVMADREAVEEAASLAQKTRAFVPALIPSVCAAVRYRTMRYDEKRLREATEDDVRQFVRQSDRFFRDFIYPPADKPGNPARVVNRYFVRRGSSSKRSGGEMWYEDEDGKRQRVAERLSPPSRIDATYLMCTAWANYRDGREMARIQLPKGGAVMSDIPLMGDEDLII